MGKDTSLTYSLYGKDVSASKALKNVGDEANKAHSHFSNLKTTALGVFAGNLLTSGATALVGAVGSAVSAAAAYETLGAKTAAVLKSTGNAAHTSVKGIQDLAGQLEQLSGVDEEQIINSQNVLATFTKVQNGVGKGNDIFDQATKAALNMSTALGTDLQGSTLQIGKALNDPLKGITALSRAGVSFTQQQKDQIKEMVKSGDQMGAQKLILKELNTEFGGAAKAAGEGFNGSMARLKDSVGDAGRNIATKLLPTITNVADGLNDLIKGDFAGFRDKMKEIGEGIKTFAQDIVKKVADAWPKVKEQFAKWGLAFVEWLPDAVTKFYTMYGDFEIKVIQKIVELLPKVTAKFQQFVGAASDWIGEVLPIWVTKLADLVLQLGEKITEALPDILDKLGKWQRAFADWIPGAVSKLLANVSKLGNRLSDWVSAHGSEIVSDLVQWAVHFAGFVLHAIPGLLKNMARLVLVIGKWVITDGVPLAVKALLNLGKAIIVGLWDGIAAGTENFRSKMIKWFKDNVIGGVKKLLGIASPSKVFFEIGGNVSAGFANGMDQNSGRIIASASNMSKLAMSSFTNATKLNANISATTGSMGVSQGGSIVPINGGANSMASNGNVNVTIHVAGSVVQERDLAVSVRDNIAQMMRRRGLNPNILGV